MSSVKLLMFGVRLTGKRVYAPTVGPAWTAADLADASMFVIWFMNSWFICFPYTLRHTMVQLSLRCVGPQKVLSLP